MLNIMTMFIFLTGSGAITKTALAAFYRSVIGLNTNRVDEIIDTAYDRMTSVSYYPTQPPI